MEAQWGTSLGGEAVNVDLVLPLLMNVDLLLLLLINAVLFAAVVMFWYFLHFLFVLLFCLISGILTSSAQGCRHVLFS